MKITFIGVFPPEKSLCHYCYHLTNEISKIIELEIFSFKKLTTSYLTKDIKSIKNNEQLIINPNIKFNINIFNPLSWVITGLNVSSDVVHVQHWSWYTGLVYFILFPILKLRNKKIIITIHNITPHTTNKITIFFDKSFNKIIFKLSDFYIVHNKRNENKLIQIYNVNKEKIEIITHGILDFPKKRHISKNEARKILNLPLNKKIILFFGYLWQYKGLDILLKSIKTINKTNKNIILFIVGRPFRDWWKYEKIINNLDLTNYVISKLGYIPDSEIQYYFSAADIFVFPYKKPFDTHGGAAALAITFKKPVIVTDIGGLPSFVMDNRAISRPEDVDALSKNILRVLTDNELYIKLSKDSELLSKKLSWDKIAKKTIELYTKVK